MEAAGQGKNRHVHCAEHSDEPLKTNIVFGMASTMFESHLHCTKRTWRFFLFPLPIYVTAFIFNNINMIQSNVRTFYSYSQLMQSDSRIL